MPSAPQTTLVLELFGLEPREARATADSGFSSPTWTWPEGLEGEGALDRLLAGRFVAPTSVRDAEPDCREDDPDRQALVALGDDTRDEVDALTRAMGDWLLDGGSRDGFAERIAGWRAEGFDRLLCFDPVHLKAETDHAITLGPRFLGLEDEELDQLLAGMNTWLAGDGMRAERIGRQVYLLARLSADGVGPAADTLARAGAPLACLLNRNAGVFLDESHSEPVLRQWLTEVQMWLYPQALNDERAAGGRPILNSFWPHGMSALSDGPPAAAPSEPLIVSDSPAVLARHEAISWSPEAIEDVSEAIAARRPVRLLLTEGAWCRLEGDLGGFREELGRIDAWLADLQARRPRLAVRLGDGQGGVWRAESSLVRAWRALLGRWRR